MKTLSDRIVATIRTGVPALVGLVLATLISKIPAVADVFVFIDTHLAEITLGVPVATLIQLGATAGVITAYYWAARELGERFPALEKWLLGYDAIPVYDPVAVIDPESGDPLTLTRREYRALTSAKE